MARTVVLGKRRDEDGVWMRSVTLDDGGDLVIEGHDIGPGVEEIMGMGAREYEFRRRVPARSVGAVRRALGLGEDEDLLDALEERYAPRGTAELESLIAAARIESEFDSWISD